MFGEGEGEGENWERGVMLAPEKKMLKDMLLVLLAFMSTAAIVT